MNPQEIFGKIYSEHVWGDGTKDSPLSGGGSLAVNAQDYVDFVRKFIENNQVESVVDFGHGDWQMWKNYTFENVTYFGLDVANKLSENIQQIYGNDKRSFQQIEPRPKNFPKGDLLITKDVLQHIPNKDVEFFLNKMTTFKYVIICNDIIAPRFSFYELRNMVALKHRISLLKQLKIPKLQKRPMNNVEIAVGEFRGIDLESNPFSSQFDITTILKTIDYDGPKRPGIRKRIYLISNHLK
ncbi:hypothetical protein MCEMRE195_00071 [Candidatus Nanopelagicaceae bacterium]